MAAQIHSSDNVNVTFDEKLEATVEDTIDRKLTEIAGTTILGALKAALAGAIPVIEKRFKLIEEHLNLQFAEGDTTNVACSMVVQPNG